MSAANEGVLDELRSNWDRTLSHFWSAVKACCGRPADVRQIASLGETRTRLVTLDSELVRRGRRSPLAEFVPAERAVWNALALLNKHLNRWQPPDPGREADGYLLDGVPIDQIPIGQLHAVLHVRQYVERQFIRALAVWELWHLEQQADLPYVVS